MHKAQSFAATGVQRTVRPTVERLLGRVIQLARRGEVRAVIFSAALKQDF